MDAALRVSTSNPGSHSAFLHSSLSLGGPWPPFPGKHLISTSADHGDVNAQLPHSPEGHLCLFPLAGARSPFLPRQHRKGTLPQGGCRTETHGPHQPVESKQPHASQKMQSQGQRGPPAASCSPCRLRKAHAGGRPATWSSEWPHCVLTNCTCHPGGSDLPPLHGQGHLLKRGPALVCGYRWGQCVTHGFWLEKPETHKNACLHTPRGTCCSRTQVKGQSQSRSGWAAGHRCSGGAVEKGDPGTHTLLTDKVRGLRCADKPMSFSAAQAARWFPRRDCAEQAISGARGERVTQRPRGPLAAVPPHCHASKPVHRRVTRFSSGQRVK